MREQSISINSEQGERTIPVGSERSVLHGIDGVSPIATVTQTETGATISITDRDGTTTADIKNGKDGKDGKDGSDGTPGTPGKDGESATISVGTTTTGNPGTNASVSNSGTASAAILNFTIPRGATGATGAAGRDGTDGRAGKDGQDGFSPTANVTKSGDTATITITDKNGTTTAQVKDGTGYTETDPIFSASPAAGITSANITTWNNKSDFSGNYNDLTNKPTIPTAGTITSGSTGYATGGDVYNAIGNIETILSTLNNGGGAQ